VTAGEASSLYFNSSDQNTNIVIRQGRSTGELFTDQADVPPSGALTKSLAKTITAKMKAPPPATRLSTGSNPDHRVAAGVL
jgi:hypothetical protein